MWETFIRLITRYPLDFISQLFALLPIFVGLIRYRRLSVPMKWVVLAFITYFLKDSVALMYSLRKESNLYLYNLQSFFEIAVVALIYSFSMPKQAKQILWLAGGCLVVNVFFYSNQEISAGNLTIARLFIIVVVLLYLTHVLNEAVIRNIMRHDMFWLSAGLLLYAAGTFFVFLFGNYLFDVSTSDETFDFYWSLQEIIFIIFCVLAAIGLRFSEFKNVSSAINR